MPRKKPEPEKILIVREAWSGVWHRLVGEPTAREVGPHVASVGCRRSVAYDSGPAELEVGKPRPHRVCALCF